jgi:predicted nucleic acid-binding Zn finger protein
MKHYETPAEESDGIEIEPRTERALSEALSVLTLEGHPVESPDRSVVMVVSHSGETYHVDAAAGVCECPDYEYNLPEGDRETCKHIARARISLGRQPVDAQVLAEVDVDNTLAANAPGPVVATSDGGIIEAGDEGEVLDEGDGDGDGGRPDECDCGDWNADADLPCWPCYRDGFEEPASAE